MYAVRTYFFMAMVFLIVQKCHEISKFDLKKSEKIKDAKTLKILEETFRKSGNVMQTKNLT